jgi:methylated-DNA-protein-cysteine methyltransferase-like protein
VGFFNDVYEIVIQIPPGKVSTYGQIARLMGQPRKAKYVGWALHKNPKPGEIPCHRVVDRNGSLSGSFAFGGQDVQKKMLENEGIEFEEDGRVNLEKYLWRL